MARIVFEYDPPDRFVAGTVGEPGQRTFFLQATGGGRTTSVALEKQQVAVLAERVEALLDEVVRQSSGEAAVPAVTPADVDGHRPAGQPRSRRSSGSARWPWPGTPTTRSWSSRPRRSPTSDEDDDDETPLIDDEAVDGPPLLRVRLTGSAARAFVTRAQAVVAAGRPPCPFCGGPLDAGGHVCPRANGYRR